MTSDIFLLGVLQASLSGIILIAIKSGQSKAKKRREEEEKLKIVLEEAKEQRTTLVLEGLNASFCVNKEVARCIRGERPNGELTSALDYQTEVKHKIEDFLRKQNSRV